MLKSRRCREYVPDEQSETYYDFSRIRGNQGAQGHKDDRGYNKNNSGHRYQGAKSARWDALHFKNGTTLEKPRVASDLKFSFWGGTI